MATDETLRFDNKSSLLDIFGFKTISVSNDNPEKLSKSHNSSNQPSENLLLKKNEEILNFDLKNNDQINLNCDAERLILTKEEKTRSDSFALKTGMSLFSEMDLIESETDDFTKTEKKLSNYAPVRSQRATEQSFMKSDNRTKNNNFWSKILFDKARLVNYLFKRNEKTSKRNTFTQLNVTLKKDDKPKLFREIFADPEVPEKEDLETKQYFKDLLIFIIYLVFLTAIALSMVSAHMYYFTDITAALFFDSQKAFANKSLQQPTVLHQGAGPKYSRKSLRKLNTWEDFWNFAESTMNDLFYWNFYNSEINPTAHAEEDNRKMFHENQILGVPRMRQVRVTNDSCSIHPNLKRFFNSCYYYYSPFAEETKPIKEGMETSLTPTAWVYTKAQKLNTSYYWGEISLYGGGGYYLDLASNRQKSKQMLKELKENSWVSRATRAIFIDFNLYNANANLFCLCKIVLEFPPVGGIIPKADFHSLKLIRYLTTFDFFILGCEFVLLLFIFYFTWKLIEKGFQQKTAFFLTWWNYVDMIIVLLSFAFVVLSIIRYMSVAKLLPLLESHFDEYTEFCHVKDLQIHFNNIVGVLLFVSWIKLFVFLTFNVIMMEFQRTLEKSIKCILWFIPMFLTVYLAFVLLAYLFFGNQIKDCHTVWLSFLFLLRAFLGEFQYNEIRESNRILGPIFYVVFIFFIFFILVNMFVAIINDAYASVKSEVTLIKPKVGEYTKRGFINLITCCHTRKKLKKKTSLKKKFILDKITEALQSAGFTLNEIRIFFSKYNINVHNLLHNNVRRKIMEDLELRRVDFSDIARQRQINSLRRNIDHLNTRIEDVEMNLQPVIDKVDILLDRLSSKKYT